MTKATKPRKRKRSTNRGALVILACVFVLSAGARIMSGTGAAIAREFTQSLDSEHSSKGEIMGATCETDETIAALMGDLNSRRASIEERENALAQKMKTLELASIQVSKNMVALEQAESRLAATMTTAQTAAEDDLSKLTAVYENMKPKEAAALFEQMSPDFAAGFLARMNSESAAAVMAGLAPETAYSVSVILAGRNANAPSK